MSSISRRLFRRGRDLVQPRDRFGSEQLRPADLARAWLDSSPARPPPRPRTTWRWVSPGESVSVAGTTIPGGMFYLGSGLPALAGSSPEPALIDPALPVNRSRPDRNAARVSYWPSYSGMTPSARAAYLDWLAAGRRAPNTPTAYLSLFFYGLERRLLVDLGVNGDPVERDAIVGEIEALLSVHGGDYTFRLYAERLLDVVRATRSALQPLDNDPPPVRGSIYSPAYSYQYTLPVALQLGLGRFAVERRPLPAPWALAWLQADPAVRLRSLASRVPEEFGELFALYYAERFGAGLILRPGRGVLSLQYYPASPSFGGMAKLTTDIPPINAPGRALQRLQPVADRCADALEAYSRRRGYDLRAPPTLAMLAHLPPELLARRDDEPLRRLRALVEGAISDGDVGNLDAAQLIACWSSATPGRMTRGEASSLAQLLDTLGFGLEPDVRYGGPTPSPAGSVIVFRLPRGAENDPSAGYAGDAAFVELAAAVAAADGAPTESQRRLVDAAITLLPALTPAERTRLRFHARWALGAGLGTAGAKARVGLLAGRDPLSVVQFLIRVAAADGAVSPAEITLLRKLCVLIGLPPDDLYREIHALAIGASEPVTIRPAEHARSGFRIPQRKPRAVDLDPAKVQRKQEESEAAAALLGAVFAEEEQRAPAARPVLPSVDGAVGGLDRAHATLLRRLGTAARWSRAEAEALAREAGLLLDGALDTLNDVAFDQTGGPVWEGDDPIEIEQAAVARVLTEEASA